MTGSEAVPVAIAGDGDVLAERHGHVLLITINRPDARPGTVVSWAVVHERTADGSDGRRPVGIVELDEGPWWWTSIAGVDPAGDLFGRRVQVAFEKAGDGETIPFFTEAEETSR